MAGGHVGRVFEGSVESAESQVEAAAVGFPFDAGKCHRLYAEQSDYTNAYADSLQFWTTSKSASS